MCRWTIPRCVPLPRCWRKCPKYDDGGGERRWRHQNFGCYGVEFMGLAPRVACAEHGVVVAQVPWAEPGSRFTRDFEMECAWLTAVANQKTVSGFLRIAWRTASHIARAGSPPASRWMRHAAFKPSAMVFSSSSFLAWTR